MKAEQKYWFPAKRYGWVWGWGFPNGLAGWLVLAAFGMLVVIGFLAFPPDIARVEFVAYMTSL